MREAKLIKSRAVVRDHNNGMRIKEIAKKYDLSTETIRQYIKAAKNENPEMAAAQEEKQKEIKAQRDKERHQSLKARSELSEKRKEKVKAYVDRGMSRHEAAEKAGLSYVTVTDYIRSDKIPIGALTYKDTLRIGQSIGTLRAWAEKKVGNIIQTPEGKMIMICAHPYIVECAKRCTKGFITTTFTLGEVYYANQGGDD